MPPIDTTGLPAARTAALERDYFGSRDADARAG